MRTIRPAIASDWPNIWQMFHAVVLAGDAFAYDEQTTEDAARKLWFEPPAVCYVAKEESDVIGTYFVRPNQPGRGNHVANAGYIVAPAARGKGLAQELCEHSLQTARQMGYLAMQFNFVIATNSPAIRVWEKCGFSVVGRLPGAFRHKELGMVDVLVMHQLL